VRKLHASEQPQASAPLVGIQGGGSALLGCTRNILGRSITLDGVVYLLRCAFYLEGFAKAAAQRRKMMQSNLQA
jgi:hypothetical protein